MAKHSIRDYLNKIVDIYRDSSAKVAELYVQYKACDDAFRATYSSKQLTREGKQKEQKRLDECKAALRKDMAKIRVQARTDAEQVKKELDTTFYALYHPTEEGIDERTVKLIESGILTPAELLKRAESADITTRRLIGKALEGKNGYQNQARALLASTNDPHLRAADELIGIGDYSVGGAPLSGVAGAKHFNKKLDTLCKPVIDASPRWAMDCDILTLKTSYVRDDD